MAGFFWIIIIKSIKPINDNEKTLDDLKKERPNEDIDNLITGRESDWKKQTGDLLKENLGKTKRVLDDLNSNDKPMKLLRRAKKNIRKL